VGNDQLLELGNHLAVQVEAESKVDSFFDGADAQLVQTRGLARPTAAAPLAHDALLREAARRDGLDRGDLGVLARSAPKCWKIAHFSGKKVRSRSDEYHVARELAAEKACLTGAF
jgi:hypothetical protein